VEVQGSRVDRGAVSGSGKQSRSGAAPGAGKQSRGQLW
jgi:hypothetical protein